VAEQHMHWMQGAGRAFLQPLPPAACCPLHLSIPQTSRNNIYQLKEIISTKLPAGRYKHVSLPKQLLKQTQEQADCWGSGAPSTVQGVLALLQRGKDEHSACRLRNCFVHRHTEHVANL